MTARTCMACGSGVGDDAERCDACGAEQESRLFHEGSDVRLEPNRLGEELPTGELSLPAGRWSRASEHPKVDPISSRVLENQSAPPPSAKVHEDALEIPSAPPLPHPDAAEAAGASTSAAERVAPAGTDALRDSAPQGNGASARTDDAERRPLPPLDEVSLLTLATPPDPRAGTTPHTAVVRPPVLASEALRRDLTPAEPGPHLLRFWSPVLGLLGVLATWLLTQGRGVGAPLCGAFAALTVLGIPRMPYVARAAAVATVSATGLTIVLWTEMDTVAGPSSLVLALTVVVLAAGLYFRSWHRASGLARILVVLGVMLGASFLWMNETFVAVTMFDTAWQSWAPHLVVFPFGILLMLALLSFMNARTTAGAAACATLLLLWHALYSVMTLLRAVWPKNLGHPDLSLVEPEAILAFGGAPIFTALLALSSAQLIASGIARTTAEPQPRRTSFEPIH